MFFRQFHTFIDLIRSFLCMNVPRQGCIRITLQPLAVLSSPAEKALADIVIIALRHREIHSFVHIDSHIPQHTE